MNQVFNVAHKAAVGTLVFFSLWGTYSVAGGTGIIIKRRWDRKMNAPTDEEIAAANAASILSPIKPNFNTDLNNLKKSTNKHK